MDRIAGKDVPAVIDVSPSMRSALEVRGAFDPDRVLPFAQKRSANWDPINPSRIIDTARKSVVVYACLTYLADAVAESPLRIYRSAGDDRTEVPDHRARQVIANPNPFMSEAEFWALLVMAMGMQGYAIVEMVRSAGGLPVEIWPLRPDWLTKKLQPDGRGAAIFTYRVPGADPRDIPKDDLILIPYRHDDRLESPGVSPLQIAAREVGIDSSLTEFLKVFLDSGGIPPFVLEYPDPIPDPVIIDQMQTAWAQKYGGSRSYGKLPILHGGYHIVKVGDGINDMAWPDLRAITEDKICQAFRVPRELVQTHSTAAGGSGLTTTEQEGAMLSLQRYGATPLRNRIDGAFTRSFLNQFTGGDPQYELQFDVSDVLALQEDADKKHTRVRADWDSGLLTMDEARQELGMQPLPSGQGEVFKVAFTTVFTRPAELAPATVTETPPKQLPAATGGKSRRYRDETKLAPAALELRKSLVNQNRRDQKRLSDVLNRKLVKFFRDQGARIVAEAQKSYRPFDVRSIAEIYQIDWDAESQLLSEILDRFYATTGDAAAAAASSTLGVSVSWDLANPNIARTMKQLGTRVVGITETTREDVARIVTESLQEGVTIDELSARLTGQFEETYKGRSLAIAKTESQVAYNTASIVSYQESGVVSEAELADNPDHTDDYGASDGLSCADRNGLVVLLADVARHIEAEHPNGSLAVLPVVSLGE